MKEIKLTRKDGQIRVLDQARLFNLLTGRDPRQLLKASKDHKQLVSSKTKIITDSKLQVELTVSKRIKLKRPHLQHLNMGAVELTKLLKLRLRI